MRTIFDETLVAFQIFWRRRFQLLRGHHLSRHLRRKLQPASGRCRHRNRSTDRIGRIRSFIRSYRKTSAPRLQLGLHVAGTRRIRILFLLQRS